MGGRARAGRWGSTSENLVRGFFSGVLVNPLGLPGGAFVSALPDLRPAAVTWPRPLLRATHVDGARSTGTRGHPSSARTPPQELRVGRSSADVRVLIYAIYSSSRRCYRSLRTEIKICILQVQIYCTYSFTVSQQGAPLIL